MAVAALVVAAALAFISVYIRKEHDIEAGMAMVIAQFLTFSATILGVDYKFNNNHGYNTERIEKQQSIEH